MSNQQTLSFAACPNHQTNEGFNKLYRLGNGMFKCSLCGKELTRDEVQKEIEIDYAMRIRDLQVDYQQNLARLYADKKENLDVVDAG
jgi:transcription initiation factor IIE alpha subunit